MRNIIITGAGDGVGKAVATMLKKENLILVDIEKENVEKVAKLGVLVGFMGVGYGVGLKNSLKTVIEHEDARVKDVEKQVSHANDEIEEIKEILASNNIVQRYPAHGAQEEK